MEKFQQFCTNVKAMAERDLSKGYLEAKNQLVGGMWSKIDNTYEEIIEVCTEEYEVTVDPEVSKVLQAIKKEYAQAFDMYDSVTIYIQEALEKLTKKENPQIPPLQLPENLVLNTNNKSNIKLKPIDIPTFTGDYKKWISFKSMFESLVHDSDDFNDLQRIHYLKSCLDGEAKRILAQFDITEASYKPAYEALKDRFHNEVILVDTHIISILAQANLTTESSSGLKELHDVTTENLRALETLKIEVGKWDPILLLLIVQKLDPSSRRLWEQTLQPKVRPTMKQFLDFLSTRFHALGCQQKFSFSMEPTTINSRYRSRAAFKFSNSQSESTSFPPRNHQSFHNSTDAPQICPFRCIEPHDMMKCERFLKADAQTRRDLVTCAKLCKNCLKPHNGRCSMQPGCQTCRQYHHPSLHYEIVVPTTTTPATSSTKPANRSTSDSGQNVMTSLRTHHVHLKQPIAENQQKVVVEDSDVIRWDESVFLATAIVLVRSNRDNRLYPFRALLDGASEASYASEYLTQKLGLVKQGVFANSTGLGGVITGRIKHIVEFEIGSKQNPAFRIKVQGPVTTKVTNSLPSSFIKKVIGNTLRVCHWLIHGIIYLQR